MRRLIRLAIYLYPAAWRKRYAREFDALLEDVSPRRTDVLNVLGGALKMQLTQGHFWKIAVGFALAGALIAGAVGWFGMPDKYSVTGVFSMPAAATQAESNVRVHELVQRLFSRTVLSEVMMRESLYQDDRQHEPLEDVIEKMRTRDLRVHILPSSAFALDFVYPDRAMAEKTVKDLTARMQAEGGPALLELSGKQVAPNRFLIACMGLGAGLFIGVAIAGTMRMRRRTVAISGACGFTGFMLAGAISFAIPNTYVSRAVLRVPNAANFERDALSREALKAIVEKHRLYFNEWEKKSKDQLIDAMRAKDLHVTSSATVLHLSFAYREPFAAQSVMLDLLQQYRQPLQIEVLDAPSLEQSPVRPNRSIIAILGLSLGLLVGGVFARVRHPAIA
jgi:hypothetical protein